jgi:hypothetical protein
MPGDSRLDQQLWWVVGVAMPLLVAAIGIAPSILQSFRSAIVLPSGYEKVFVAVDGSAELGFDVVYGGVRQDESLSPITTLIGFVDRNEQYKIKDLVDSTYIDKKANALYALPGDKINGDELDSIILNMFAPTTVGSLGAQDLNDLTLIHISVVVRPTSPLCANTNLPMVEQPTSVQYCLTDVRGLAMTKNGVLNAFEVHLNEATGLLNGD